MDQATAHYQQSLALSQKFQDSAWTVYAHYCLGIIFTERDTFDQAQSHFDAAVAILEQTGMGSLHALKHKIEPAFVQVLLQELGEAALPALTELLAHPDPEVRRYAGEMLPPETALSFETATIAAPDTTLHVTSFGDFKVTYRGQGVGEPGWLATKAGELFAYFITFRDSGIPRDRILEALWPETRPGQSSGAFHTALYKLRQMLRMDQSDVKFVRTRSGEYYLEKEHFWIDADEFTTLDAECLQHQHESMDQGEACIERLQRVVSLYQGDYLSNLYYDWALDEQRRLQELCLNALQILAQHHANRGDYEPALAYWRQTLEKDPLLENVHRQMMYCYGQLAENYDSR